MNNRISNVKFLIKMLNLKNSKIAIAGLLTIASASAIAGPPFVTDDPEPVEYQHSEIAYALTMEHNQEGTAVEAPSIDINYGLLPDVQIHMQPKLTYEKTSTHKHYGVDNLEVGIKYRFFNYHDQKVNWMVATYPMLLLPTADKTLNPDRREIQTFLPIWVQRDSKDWSIYGGAGYRINQGNNTKNSYFVGITALYHVADNLQLGGELFHESPDQNNGKASVGFNLGGKYDLSNHYHLLFSSGKGLVNIGSTNKLSAYLAIQSTF